MSWRKYPLYEEMLKNGELADSGKVDVISMKDLKIKKVPNSTWAKHTASCPVCTHEVYLYNPYTHKCHGCGYSFRTIENVREALKEK
jgi:hypothetical protein